jgi:hypothetical protein
VGQFDLERLRREIEDLTSRDFRRLAERAITVATHRKWLVAESSEDRLRIWLHAYHTNRTRSTTYAASVHNHRYSFVSRILTGGFSEERLEIVSDNSQILDWRSLGLVARNAGTTYACRFDEVHRLHDVLPDTRTLVVELPPRRQESDVFDLETGRIVTQRPPDDDHANRHEYLI